MKKIVLGLLFIGCTSLNAIPSLPLKLSVPLVFTSIFAVINYETSIGIIKSVPVALQGSRLGKVCSCWYQSNSFGASCTRSLSNRITSHLHRLWDKQEE